MKASFNPLSMKEYKHKRLSREEISFISSKLINEVNDLLDKDGKSFRIEVQTSKIWWRI